MAALPDHPRPPEGRIEQLLAEIAKVNQPGMISVRIASPLLPGEERDLEETLSAMKRLRGRELLAHALITNVLIVWVAEASAQNPSVVLQRLALDIDAYLTAVEHHHQDPNHGRHQTINTRREPLVPMW